MIERRLKLPIPDHSFFLFGPRQTGKTTLVRKRLVGTEPSLEIDLLRHDLFLKYKTNPGRFRQEVDLYARMHSRATVFVDEIQKVPELLGEIHLLMEKHGRKLCFVLTGSSARKLKRSAANLLGGRAWSLSLHPLTHDELRSDLALDVALRFGTLPPVHGLEPEDAIRTLDAYSGIYVKEEVLGEALVRNVPAFGRFLELAADSSGQTVNLSAVARETATASRTIREYYQILEDTLIALRLDPYLRSARKRIVTHPRYHLFDLGVTNGICGRLHDPVRSGTSLYGRLFEQFVVLEAHRSINYSGLPWRMYHWRTSHGAEVDLVLERPGGALYAIEIKSRSSIDPRDLTGLRQFLADYPHARGACVCLAEHPYRQGGILFLPWRPFLEACSRGQFDEFERADEDPAP